MNDGTARLRARYIANGTIVPNAEPQAVWLDVPTLRLDDAGRRAAARALDGPLWLHAPLLSA